MASASLVNVSRYGSYLCEHYELRVTGRCLSEDLGRESAKPFEELSDHEIIKAFVNRRRSSPDNTRKVSPLSSGKTVFRLAYGDRHRGATWFDEPNRVVWLLAYAQHEFKDAGDAFPYFKELDATDRLLPTEADYERLFLDREKRFVEVVGLEAAALLERARQSPGKEQRAVIGGDVGVGVAVEVVEALEETYLAVNLQGLTPDNLPILLAAFFPDCAMEDLEDARAMPERDLGEDEIAFRALRG